MHGLKVRILRLAVACVLACSLSVGATSSYAGQRTTEPAGWYNADYIFAATRGVNEMDMSPALKVTLVPVTLVLDTAFLPFALIVGLFGY